MCKKSSQIFPLYATLFTLLSVLILCGLGTWQMQRGAWKRDILIKLDQAYDGAGGQAQNLSEQGFSEGAFLYGRAEGRFLVDKALFIGPRTKGEDIGYHLIVPLETNAGPLFVNLGFAKSKDSLALIKPLSDQVIWFEGLARAPDWNSFTPDNLPADDLWYKLDLEEMARAKSLAAPLPYMLYAERAAARFNVDIFPNNERWRPNNNHGQYMLFWFSMAGVLVIIYGLRFLRKP